MSALASFLSGRRTKWVVIAPWIAAAVELLGDRVWWPSTARGGGHALRERAEEPVAEPV